MSTRKNLFGGITLALVLVGGVAWAASSPGPSTVAAAGDVRTTQSTVVPIDGVGQVTLEELEAGLSVVSAIPVEGWSVVIERPVGSTVEVRFAAEAGGRVDVTAQLEGDGVRVDIRRELAAETTASSTLVTSTTGPDDSTTSTSLDDDGSTTSTSLDDGSTTSTSLDDGSTTTTSLDDGSTTTTSLDDGSTTSTSVDDGSTTSTSPDDDDGSIIADGLRTFVVEGAATVTIDVRSGTLVLLGIDVTSGWTAEIDKQEPDEIRIEFEGSGDAEAELRVRVRSGGLEVETRRD